jgi:hypothetical protein
MRRLDASLGGLITPCSYMFAPYPRLLLAWA